MDKKIKVVLSVVVAGLIGYGIYVNGDMRRDRLKGDIVEVPIGAYSFAFPRNTINHISYGDKEHLHRTSIELVFILPELDLITEQNRDRLNVGNRLRINLSARHYDGISDEKVRGRVNSDLKLDSQRWIDLYFGAKNIKGDGFAYPRIGQGKKVGDLFLYERNEKISSHQDLYTNASDQVEFLLDCTPYGPNPMCSLHASMLGHISIYYAYPRKYISQATQINNFVLSYLQSHFKGVTDHD